MHDPGLIEAICIQKTAEEITRTVMSNALNILDSERNTKKYDQSNEHSIGILFKSSKKIIKLSGQTL